LADRRFDFLHKGFEHTVLSYRAGYAKPDRSIYQFAADEAGCDPGSILFIDDISEHVKAAQSFGFDGIIFKGFPDLLNELTKRELIQ
jgi:HAD superfamily hydrolase (TIGR01509 family)